MKGSSLGYLIKEGAKNVYINRLMSFASIGTLVACMILIGSSLLFSMNVNSIVGYVEQQNDIPVFLKDGLKQEQIDDIQKQINDIENIYECTFISKNQLLESYQSEMGDLLSGLEDDNPLFDSFTVRVTDLGKIATTIMQLENIEGVDKVPAPSDTPEIVTGIKKAVSTSGIIVVAILIVVSLVIIANTIKVTIFNRRKEISIMKYVGATDTFIRLPFFVEGFLLGIISAVLAFGLLWYSYDYVMQSLSISTASWIQQAYGNMVQFDDVAVDLFTWFAGGGISIGVFGSMFFVNRYLKV